MELGILKHETSLRHHAQAATRKFVAVNGIELDDDPRGEKHLREKAASIKKNKSEASRAKCKIGAQMRTKRQYAGLNLRKN